MTRNQLTYWANKETARANAAKEAENERHNRVSEVETERSNRANEAEDVRRHNQQYEVEKVTGYTSGFKNIAQGIFGNSGIMGGMTNAASVLGIL